MPQIFISNVPWNCRESELRELFESKGFPVESVRLVRDLVAQSSPSFAYVTLRDNQQNGKATEATNGEKLKDNILRVQEDRRRTQLNSGRRRSDK
ncbi:MAG TPA: RNA-binding protein [Terriglobia bacterium]|nr:RNA-binding protein [Terriglobia bacterium]